MIKLGQSQKEISITIVVHKSTVSRERKRNVNKRGKHSKLHSAHRAEIKAIKREQDKRKRDGLTVEELKYIRK